MSYAFNLNWDDLDEELQTAKIDEYITHGYEHSEYKDQDGEPLYKNVEEAIEASENRDDADKYIRAHFPLYF